MRIVLATTGQPSTNPRLVKEANALVEAGHKVKVYYCFWADWANKTDSQLLESVDWDYELVGGSPQKDRIRFFFNKIRFKFYQKISRYFNIYLEQSRCKAFSQLLAALKKENADHYISHNLGSLAAIAKTAKYQKKSFSFDAEDFHRGQYTNSCRNQEIDTLLEDRYFSEARFITTASPLITKAYKEIYPKQQFITINNVFPKEEFKRTIAPNNGAPLKLVWFSQTIGLNRGLETIFKALNNIDEYSVEVNLFGNYSNQTYSILNSLLENKKHKLNIFKPLSPKELNSELSNFDIGIASEIALEPNRDICLTNKIFSYVQAGLCVLASATKAQSLFLTENPNIGFIHDSIDSEEIVNLLNMLNYNRDMLQDKKKSSLTLAELLNWNNEKEKIINLLENKL